MVEDCLFCKIVAGEIPADIVYESETAIGFRDINPQAPVNAGRLCRLLTAFDLFNGLFGDDFFQSPELFFADGPFFPHALEFGQFVIRQPSVLHGNSSGLDNSRKGRCDEQQQDYYSNDNRGSHPGNTTDEKSRRRECGKSDRL